MARCLPLLITIIRPSNPSKSYHNPLRFDCSNASMFQGWAHIVALLTDAGQLCAPKTRLAQLGPLLNKTWCLTRNCHWCSPNSFHQWIFDVLSWDPWCSFWCFFCQRFFRGKSLAVWYNWAIGFQCTRGGALGEWWTDVVRWVKQLTIRFCGG